MKYFALAADYDGTLAADGRVSASTIKALEKIRNSGRKLLLVTGRELGELLGIFPGIKLFDIVVAENGALLYFPETGEEKLLGDPPPPEFISELQKRKVFPLSAGRVIVATWKPHEVSVLNAIRDLGLELQVIFNKDAVMILPSGINKAYGFYKALNELKLSPLNVVAVGDAENDHAFFRASAFSAAVSNSVPMLKETADYCLKGDHGEGVSELIEMIIKDDLAEFENKVKRHKINLVIEQSRHTLKYAKEELDADNSFYFSGPEGKLKLRAQTLQMFIQLAEGVDNKTWDFHLRNGDYADWFREKIKDDELAGEAEKVSRNKNISAEESRNLIKQKIQERYTGPA